MIPELEALLAVAREGSTVRAATALRLSQSTVSRRILDLADQVGVPLFESEGRGLKLTGAGRRLAEAGGPLLAALRETLSESHAAARTDLRLVVGVTESLLASWAPELIARLVASVPGFQPELHAHRGPVAADRVRSGEYALALIAGSVPRDSELKTIDVGEEEMVLVVPVGKPPRLARGKRVPVWTIEAESGTWRGIRRSLREFEKTTGIDLRPEHRLESFAPLVQLALAGFGPALVPAGIALAMRLPPGAIRRLPAPRIHRPIRLVSRRKTLQRPELAGLLTAIEELVPVLIAERARPG